MRSRSIAFPVIIILLGMILLLRNMFPDLYWLLDLHQYWPVLLIAWGVLMLGRRTSGWRSL